jgi:hypothetical protein
MKNFKNLAEYFRIGLLNKIEDANEVSKWADEIILSQGDEIPEWALELTLAKSKKLNELIMILNRIEGDLNKEKVIDQILLRIYKIYKLKEFDFAMAIRKSYRIMLNNFNIFQDRYDEKVRGIYCQIMSLDDELDRFEYERIGNEVELEEKYNIFIRENNINSTNNVW